MTKIKIVIEKETIIILMQEYLERILSIPVKTENISILHTSDDIKVVSNVELGVERSD